MKKRTRDDQRIKKDALDLTELAIFQRKPILVSEVEGKSQSQTSKPKSEQQSGIQKKEYRQENGYYQGEYTESEEKGSDNEGEKPSSETNQKGLRVSRFFSNRVDEASHQTPL